MSDERYKPGSGGCLPLTQLQAERLLDVKDVAEHVTDRVHEKAQAAEEAESDSVSLTVTEVYDLLNLASFIRSLPEAERKAGEKTDG